MESSNLQPQPPRKRRPRTNVKQLEILNEAYTLDPMPCSSYRELLGDLVGLSNRSIQICKTLLDSRVPKQEAKAKAGGKPNDKP